MVSGRPVAHAGEAEIRRCGAAILPRGRVKAGDRRDQRREAGRGPSQAAAAPNRDPGGAIPNLDRRRVLQIRIRRIVPLAGGCGPACRKSAQTTVGSRRSKPRRRRLANASGHRLHSSTGGQRRPSMSQPYPLGGRRSATDRDAVFAVSETFDSARDQCSAGQFHDGKSLNWARRHPR
jgi:hypothetical protein